MGILYVENRDRDMVRDCDAADEVTMIDYSRQELIRANVQLVQRISSEIKLRTNTVPVPPFILIMGT